MERRKARLDDGRGFLGVARDLTDAGLELLGGGCDGLNVVVDLRRGRGSRAGIDAGALVNAKAVEAMTSVLIGINIRYKIHGAGVRITGLEDKL